MRARGERLCVNGGNDYLWKSKAIHKLTVDKRGTRSGRHPSAAFRLHHLL
jgi:hypothetical protein